MKLLFKQRLFSWFDSYDIYDENGNTYFTVKGRLGWGHRFEIIDSDGQSVAELEEQIFRFLPHFNMYVGGNKIGEIVQEFTWLKPKFRMDFNGWQIDGDWYQWNYSIKDARGYEVARVSKQIFNWTDTYVMDIVDEKDSLRVLMVVITIDAARCSNRH